MMLGFLKSDVLKRSVGLPATFHQFSVHLPAGHCLFVGKAERSLGRASARSREVNLGLPCKWQHSTPGAITWDLHVGRWLELGEEWAGNPRSSAMGRCSEWHLSIWDQRLP